MNQTARRVRTPGMKLLFAVLVAAALAVPLFMVYLLVWDRQEQSQTARATITEGWGGQQVVTGPVLVVPYREDVTESTVVNGRAVDTVRSVSRNIYLSPRAQRIETALVPQRKTKSIYTSVLYEGAIRGQATFALPVDAARAGFDPAKMDLTRAELHFGVSDPRGLQSATQVRAGSETLLTRPGGKLGNTGGAGFFAFADWDGQAPLDVDWAYKLRGSETLSVVPRGGNTEWQVRSAWPHPSFSGSFLPAASTVRDNGFDARFAVSDLALGQELLTRDDYGPPIVDAAGQQMMRPAMAAADYGGGRGGPAMAATVALIEPVDLYSRIDRSVKYGFLIIGFTFLAFLMFDIVAGAAVAAPEYLLTGAGLALFFVLLLAFSEVIGFAAAYALASVAIIGLVTAYSAAVLKSWVRAKVIGALLVGLYALLFVLLNMEAWSLLIGSVLLFFALAGVMYATRKVDWQGLGARDTAGSPAHDGPANA